MNNRLRELRRRLSMYYEAEEAILNSQSYSLEGLSLTRANLATVRTTISELERAIRQEESTGREHKRSRVRFVYPVDYMPLRK